MDLKNHRKNYTIRIRVSKDQLEKITFEADNRGYKNNSHYLRDLGLNSKQILENKVIDTHKKITKILEILQK